MPAQAGVSGGGGVTHQLDGDFLLYGRAGVASERWEKHRASQFDKWGKIMKTVRWKLKGDDSSPLQRVDLNCTARRFKVSFSGTGASRQCAAPLPACQRGGGVTAGETQASERLLDERPHCRAIITHINLMVGEDGTRLAAASEDGATHAAAQQ